jgi:hypothetical protein
MTRWKNTNKVQGGGGVSYHTPFHTLFNYEIALKSDFSLSSAKAWREFLMGSLPLFRWFYIISMVFESINQILKINYSLFF